MRNDDSLVCELRFGERLGAAAGRHRPGCRARAGRTRATGRPAGAQGAAPRQRTSSSREFVETLRPSVAVLTVGRGTTVTREVLARLPTRPARRCSAPDRGWRGDGRDGRHAGVILRGQTGRELTLDGSSLLMRSHSASMVSRSVCCSESAPAGERGARARLKRRANLSFARRSAASGSMPSLRERLAMREQQIAHLLLGAPGPSQPSSVDRLAQLGHLLLDLRQDVGCAVPVEADGRGAAAHLVGAEQRRQRPGNAAEDRPMRLVAGALARLHVLPAAEDLARRRCARGAAEHVGMPADELVGDGGERVGDREVAVARRTPAPAGRPRR